MTPSQKDTEARLRADAGRPFVLIPHYQFENDVVVGNLQGSDYLLGDGDLYPPDTLKKIWPDAIFLTRFEAGQLAEGITSSLSRVPEPDLHIAARSEHDTLMLRIGAICRKYTDYAERSDFQGLMAKADALDSLAKLWGFTLELTTYPGGPPVLPAGDSPSVLGDLFTLLDECGMKMVFWVCPKGCRGRVVWNAARTDAVCQVCGRKKSDAAASAEAAETARDNP